MTGSMNLQPSLVKIALDTFFPGRQEAAKAKAKKQADRAKQMKDDPSAPDSPAAQEELAQNEPMDQADAPADAANPDAQEQAKSDADGQLPDPNAADKDDKSDKGDTASAGNDAKQDDNGQDDNSNGGKEQSGKASNKGSDKENSSLLNKVKDAMSYMWSKMTQKEAPQTNSKSGQRAGSPTNHPKRTRSRTRAARSRTTTPRVSSNRATAEIRSRQRWAPAKRDRTPRLSRIRRAASVPRTAIRRRAKLRNWRRWEKSASCSASVRRTSRAR